jgi:hypothetical protein
LEQGTSSNSGPNKGQTLEVTVGGDEGSPRLDRVLAVLRPELSRSRLKALILAGSVTARGTPIRDPAYHVAKGDTITIDLPPAVPAEPKGENIALDWSQKHVFEHRVVCDQQVGTTLLRFVADHQFAVGGLRDQSAVPMAHAPGRLLGPTLEVRGKARPAIKNPPIVLPCLGTAIDDVDADGEEKLAARRNQPLHAPSALRFPTCMRRFSKIMTTFCCNRSGERNNGACRQQPKKKRAPGPYVALLGETA